MTSRHFSLFRVKTGHFHFQNFQKSQPEDPNPVGIANIELIINPEKKTKNFQRKIFTKDVFSFTQFLYSDKKKYNFNNKINKYI